MITGSEIEAELSRNFTCRNHLLYAAVADGAKRTDAMLKTFKVHVLQSTRKWRWSTCLHSSRRFRSISRRTLFRISDY